VFDKFRCLFIFQLRNCDMRR